VGHTQGIEHWGLAIISQKSADCVLHTQVTGSEMVIEPAEGVHDIEVSEMVVHFSTCASARQRRLG
jgi:hypothetical protein